MSILDNEGHDPKGFGNQPSRSEIDTLRARIAELEIKLRASEVLNSGYILATDTLTGRVGELEGALRVFGNKADGLAGVDDEYRIPVALLEFRRARAVLAAPAPGPAKEDYDSGAVLATASRLLPHSIKAAHYAAPAPGPEPRSPDQTNKNAT